MSSLAKNIIATGVSSGVGLEALKQLLQSSQPYRVVLGARNTTAVGHCLETMQFDSANKVDVLPLDLSDLKAAKTFAEAALDKMGDAKLDYLFLNAAIAKPAKVNPYGYKWCEAAVVNHVSQFYLVHLLRNKLTASKTRIVFVSSGAVRGNFDLDSLDDALKSGAGTDTSKVYPMTKFIQLLGAHWWRRELKGVCDVVAVSPGLIPQTGLYRDLTQGIPSNHPDAKTIPQGAKSILAALTRSDFPSDPDRIFLTSWGEWWEKSEIAKTLDKALQDKWSFSIADIEWEAFNSK